MASGAGPSDYLNHPGPVDDQLLYMQKSHRSEAVWANAVRESRGQQCDGDTSRLLETKRTSLTAAEFNLRHERFLYWMGVAGFLGVYNNGYKRIDRALITALAERWRPETHTFHMPEAELTVTLQDVQVLLGLPIDGEPITGYTSVDVQEYCGRWLGRVPDEGDMKPRMLSLNWLSRTFNLIEFPGNATDGEIQRYVRATILRLIGGDLFCTKTEGYVHCMYFPFVRQLNNVCDYSWGSGCLALLYRNLCEVTLSPAKQIAGPLLLLQLWAWERFLQFRPILRSGPLQMPTSTVGSRWKGIRETLLSPKYNLSGYRYQFDIQNYSQISWEPYLQFYDRLDPACLSGRQIWTARVPLICFHAIEWHYPDRVRQQFGWFQFIPAAPFNHRPYHSITQRGRQDENWRTVWQGDVENWNNRQLYVIHSETGLERQHYHSQYGDWYRRVTRRFMTIEGVAHVGSIDTHERLRISSQTSTTELGHHHHRETGAILGALGEQRRYQDYPANMPLRDDICIPRYGITPTDTAPFSIRQRGRQSFRTDVDPPRYSCDTISQPPNWSDYCFNQQTYEGPSEVPYQQPDLIITGFNNPRYPFESFSSFQPLSGFSSYNNPRPTSQSSPIPSEFPGGGTYGVPSSSGFSTFSSGEPSHIRTGSDYATPSTNTFAPFQPQFTETRSKQQQLHTSGSRSHLDLDDDDEDDVAEDDDADEDADDDEDDDGEDDTRVEGNEGGDNIARESHERQPRQRTSLLQRILPFRNR